jgi:predicted RNA-binding protein
MSDSRFWVAVASRNHVETGVAEGIAQFCHGKLAPAKRVKKGDWIVYYSSKERFGEPTALQKFTAIGQVTDDFPYQFEMSAVFKPYRRNVKYLKCVPVDIRPLIDRLAFIKDKKHWGAVFRYGFLEVDRESFELIAGMMVSKQIQLNWGNSE